MVNQQASGDKEQNTPNQTVVKKAFVFDERKNVEECRVGHAVPVRTVRSVGWMSL